MGQPRGQSWAAWRDIDFDDEGVEQSGSQAGSSDDSTDTSPEKA